MPLGAYEAVDERLGDSPHREHGDDGDEHGGFNDAAVGRNHTLIIILDFRQDRVADTLDYAGEITGKEIRKFFGSCILSKNGWAVELSYNSLIELPPNTIEEATYEQFPSEAPHVLETFRTELEAGVPAVERPEADGINELAGELLGDECPHAESSESHDDTGGTTDDCGGDRCFSFSFEVDVATQPGHLYNAEGLKYQQQTHDAHEGDELRTFEEAGDKGCGEVEQGTHQEAHHHVDDELGAIVVVCHVLLADKGVAESTVDESEEDGGEDGDDAYESVFLRREDAREH